MSRTKSVINYLPRCSYHLLYKVVLISKNVQVLFSIKFNLLIVLTLNGDFNRFDKWNHIILFYYLYYFWRILKAPPLISLDLHILVIKCNCCIYDDNIGPRLKKSELCNIGGYCINVSSDLRLILNQFISC